MKITIQANKALSIPSNTRANCIIFVSYQFLALLVEGLSNNSIGGKAFVSDKIIRNHLTNIFDKLSISSGAEVIVLT